MPARPGTMTTLLRGAVLVTCDEQHTVHAPGDLVIQDERIVYAGPRFEGPYDDMIDARGKLIMPGMINAHTHSGMTLFRSLCDDVDLMVFLEERVWPREVHLSPDDTYAGSALASIEMLKSGVTTCVDMYFFEEALARAARDTGIRALITPTIICVPPWGEILGPWEAQLRRGLEFCGRWEGIEGRIHTGLGPHAPYTVPLDALETIAAEARRIDVPVNIHLVETAWEREQFNARGLGSTVQALDGRDFFAGRAIAAHSVWLDEGDIGVYRRSNVGVAHCPQSNMKLGAGIAPLAQLLAGGVRVGLGTDGAGTNNDLGVWEEVRTAPMLAKVAALDPKPVTAAEALWLATRLGALAIHRPDLGVLRDGYRADLAMVRLDDSAFTPIFGPETYISHLVYSADRRLIDSVWVNGRPVVRGGQLLTVDEESVRADVQRRALALAEHVCV